MDWARIVTGKPFVTKVQVISVLKERYDFKVQKAILMDGSDHQNFLVDVAPPGKKDQETNTVTLQYVLKVINSHLSEAEQYLKDVAHVMEFLSSRGFHCSKPVPNKSGDFHQPFTFPNLKMSGSGTSINEKPEDTFMIRLVTFVPGSVLTSLPLVPYNIFEEMGETLAQMHVVLQELDMDKTALQELSGRFPWSLDCLSKCRRYLYVVEDPEKRHLVEDVMNEFERVVLSRKKDLPQGFIHGDFSDVNIIVDVKDGSEEPKFFGFIDFDDVSYSCIVYDIGIALMYVLQSKTESSDSAANHFLQGYSKYREMTCLEKDCLIYCVAGRFVQSLLGGLYHYSIYKREYFLLTQERGWCVLKNLWKWGKAASFQKWNFS